MLEIKTLSLKTEDIQDEGIITGYASTEKKDIDGDVIEAGAFTKTISEKATFPLLFMHDVKQPIGLVKELAYDGKGIRFTAEIDLDIPEGQRVFSGVRKNYIDRTSVGFKTVKSRFDKATKTRHIEELKLFELSMVTKNFSANDGALVTGYKFANVIQNLKAEDLSEDDIKATINHLQSILEGRVTEPSEDTPIEQPLDSTVIKDMLQLIKRLNENIK